MAKKTPELKPKKVKPRITLLKAMPYKGIMVYLRRIDEDIFEYIIPYEGEIWTSYLIISPGKGKKKLNEDETNNAAALIFSSAVTTIDSTILRDTKIDKKTRGLVKSFEGAKKSLPN